MITSTSKEKESQRYRKGISYRRTSDVRGSAGGQTSGNLCDRTFL